MKALRILYMVIIYTVAVPLMIVLWTGFFIWITIANIRNDGKPHFKDTFEAAAEGIKIGHKCNMVWVKYGNTYDIEDLIDAMGL